MKRVFVAGLYSCTTDKNNLIGCLRNIKRGIQVCAHLISLGYVPFCPWLDFLFFLVGDYHISIQTIRAYTLSWLEVCDAMLVISNNENSGVNNEITEAKMAKIPVFYNIKSLNQWREKE